MTGFLSELPDAARGLIALIALLAPPVLLAWRLNRGLVVWPLVRALLWRFRALNAAAFGMIVVAMAMGVCVVSQDRAMRDAAQRLAERFDLVVTAPGSEIDAMSAALLAQPRQMRALHPDVYLALARDRRVSALAPVYFGGRFEGADVVYTTQDMIDLLAPRFAAGRGWQFQHEAVIGALAGPELGAWIEIETTAPAADIHDGHDHDGHVHDHAPADLTADLRMTPDDIPDGRFRVVGRMAETGTPWDSAILVPMRDLVAADLIMPGHQSRFRSPLGPQISADDVLAAPVVIVTGRSLGAVYGLQADFHLAERSNAYIPQSEIASLMRIVAQLWLFVVGLVVLTWVLVAGGTMTGFVIVLYLFRRQIGLIRAMGAPCRFVMAVLWSFAAVIITAGCCLGMALGFGASLMMAELVSDHATLAVEADFGWPELLLVMGFWSLMSVLTLIPARLITRGDLMQSLRG